ncbi:MAG: hypothetical protein HYZ37_03390 [Candidatus Solibacter usitatus]|nr:hypothetical protein [Candidatus Solibacter usitatus]
MRNILITLLIPSALLAQRTVAPTTEDVGNPRGQNTPGYNITNSVELGYRWRAVDGNYGAYRSDINFGNGIRVLGSQLRVQSKEGHGWLFDELTLNTQGLGNDPYQSAMLRLEKNGIYRYDLSWRLNEYFNPGLTIANGLHRMDTRRRFQDHDFILFPQSKFRLFAGYSRNSQDGPALITVQQFDSRGDEFPLFMDVKRQRNEYRLGGEAEISGFKLNILHGWDNFKDDTPIRLNGQNPGANPTDTVTLSALQRGEPYHGNSPYWRAVIFRNLKRFGFNARYSNVSGRRDFRFDELALGTGRFSAETNRQIAIFGSGRRPVTNASLNLNMLPSNKLTVTSHTSFNNTRMDGNGTYVETLNSNKNDSILNFQSLGIKSAQTLTDVSYAAAKPVVLYGGYHYSWREISSIDGSVFGGQLDAIRYTQQNQLHSALAGLRLRPLPGLSVQLDAEIGRADRPIYPISDRNYHALNGRVQYKRKSLTLTALTRTFYNTNSVSLTSHSSRSRQYSYDASWSPQSWLSFDAGYSKLHLDTLSGIAYFAGGLVNGTSSYVSNLHSGNLGVRAHFLKRADLFAGYSIIRDTGDGLPSYFGIVTFTTNIGGVLSTTRQAVSSAQVFPLSYQSPQARLSLKLTSRLRWNAGYQFYAYHEEFFIPAYQNYRAHTGYTSLLWSF